MSRKWERMVERNRSKVNKHRQREGKAVIHDSGKEEMLVFKGRNWSLSFFLVAFGFFSIFYFSNLFDKDILYVYTGIAYILLGLFIFAVRRPSLGIGKSKLSSHRFSGDKEVSAEEVKAITILPSGIIIEMKSKKTRWQFSQFVHRLKLEEMVPAVRQFAKQNNVTLIEESKQQ